MTAERPLLLSLFPGLDLLGLAFQQEWPQCCIVRGPDVIWGSLHKIETFHPSAGVFDGVFGGPPCQAFSRLRTLNPRCGAKHGNLIPEFCRVVAEAAPEWWLMENVEGAPVPVVDGYLSHTLVYDNRWSGGEQRRRRRFTFGSRDGRRLCPEVAVFEAPLCEQAVTGDARAVPVALGGSGKRKRTLRPPTVLAGHAPVSCESDERRGLGGRTIAEMCVLQGLPAEFADSLPFTVHGKRQAIGNAVPLPTGRIIARAVRRALEGTP